MVLLDFTAVHVACKLVVAGFYMCGVQVLYMCVLHCGCVMLYQSGKAACLNEVHFIVCM